MRNIGWKIPALLAVAKLTTGCVSHTPKLNDGLDGQVVDKVSVSKEIRDFNKQRAESIVDILEKHGFGDLVSDAKFIGISSDSGPRLVAGTQCVDFYEGEINGTNLRIKSVLKGDEGDYKVVFEDGDSNGILDNDDRAYTYGKRTVNGFGYYEEDDPSGRFNSFINPIALLSFLLPAPKIDIDPIEAQMDYSVALECYNLYLKSGLGERGSKMDVDN